MSYFSQEVKAEILNLFIIDSDVRCHSRVFGQVGDKRVSIAGVRTSRRQESEYCWCSDKGVSIIIVQISGMKGVSFTGVVQFVSKSSWL